MPAVVLDIGVVSLTGVDVSLGCSVHQARGAGRLLLAHAGALQFEAVSVLLKAEGFSLQGNSKTLEGSSHPDRDAQFAHIARSTAAALAGGQPVIYHTSRSRLRLAGRAPGH